MPSSRMHWKVLCNDGSIIADFNGTYGESLQQCASNGGVKQVWDLGLTASGYVPPFRAQVPMHAVEAAGPTRSHVPAGEVTAASPWDGKVNNLAVAAPDGFCATAVCRGTRARDQYEVVYMGTLDPQHNWFDCKSVGLNNIPISATNVWGAANNHPANACPVGKKPREYGPAPHRADTATPK